MIKVGIVGGTGYTGAELLRLLAQHPKVSVDVITSRAEEGKGVAELYPNLRGHYDLPFSAPNIDALLECDVVFFATPHGVAQSMMKPLMDGGARVIDLSADFRIRDVPLWEKWYGQPHQSPALIEKAVYGLPELNRERIRDARLIACAGCYPTSVTLGFMPLLEEKCVDTTRLIANAASGVTGAGRQAKIDNLLTEVADSFKAYGVAGHRHLPEIEQALGDIQRRSGQNQPWQSGEGLSLTFVPHLLPIIRGIHSTLYSTLTREVDLQALYEQRYANEPFVDVLPAGQYPQTRSVKGSNTCRIAVSQPQGRDTAVVMVVEDNLTKGASGQAVQNMNIMLGFEEVLGLAAPALLP